MIPVDKVAKRFENRTSFKIRHQDVGAPEDGGFAQLHNYDWRTDLPFRKGEPAVSAHIVYQLAGKGKLNRQVDFMFQGKEKKLSKSNTHTVIAHADGTVSIDVNNLTHGELAFALKHARTVQRIMNAKR